MKFKERPATRGKGWLQSAQPPQSSLFRAESRGYFVWPARSTAREPAS